MNIEQLKKYPKALLRFDEWLSEKYLHIDHDWQTNEIWVQATETAPSRRLNNYELNGLLTEFFDEQGIIMEMRLVKGYSGRGFDIPTSKWWVRIWGSSENQNITTKAKSSRQLAFDVGIEKCFEILEQLH